jgi:hypothetical protein
MRVLTSCDRGGTSSCGSSTAAWRWKGGCYAEVEVVLDENGGITRLDWTTNGQTYPLPKVE